MCKYTDSRQTTAEPAAKSVHLICFFYERWPKTLDLEFLLGTLRMLNEPFFSSS